MWICKLFMWQSNFLCVYILYIFPFGKFQDDFEYVQDTSHIEAADVESSFVDIKSESNSLANRNLFASGPAQPEQYSDVVDGMLIDGMEFEYVSRVF